MDSNEIKVAIDARLVPPTRTYLITGNPSALVRRGKMKQGSIYDALRVQKRVQENFLWVTSRSGAGRVKLIRGEGRSPKELLKEICGDLSMMIPSRRQA